MTKVSEVDPRVPAMELHPHTYLLLFLEQNIKTKPKNILDHFRKSRYCTEHVQQAVKPLSYLLEDEFCLVRVFSGLHPQNP